MAQNVFSLLLWLLTSLSLVMYLSASLPLSAKQLKPTNVEIVAFVKADKNKDRVLSKKEFKIFIRAMAAFGQSTAKTIRFFGAYGYAFSVVDKNQNGIITPWELRSADNNYRVKK